MSSVFQVSGNVQRILIVEADSETAADIGGSCRFLANLTFADDFPTARRLLEEAPDFLITNLRLGPFNGLHLVHLASILNRGTRAIVYSRYPDLALLEEARKLGAFFEMPERLASALGGYLRSSLPERERRSPRQVDRRQLYRGGRRATDISFTPVPTV